MLVLHDNMRVLDVTTDVAHSGFFSATDVGNLEMRENFAPVDTSTITQLGFWALNPNSFDEPMVYELFYADDPDPSFYLNSFLFTLCGANNNVWTYVDMTGALSSGALLVGIGINGEDRSPSTPAPLGSM